MERSCKRCGKGFSPRDNRQTYCDKRCYLQEANDRRRRKTTQKTPKVSCCVDCNKTFEQKRSQRCPCCRQEARRKSAQEYARTHVQARKETLRRWREKNKEKQRQQQRTKYWQNPERHRAYTLKHLKKHREEYTKREASRRAQKKMCHSEPYRRAEIFEQYNQLCAYCGKTAECLDHVVPIAKKGADAQHNLVPSCTSCNASKSKKSLVKWLCQKGLAGW